MVAARRLTRLALLLAGLMALTQTVKSHETLALLRPSAVTLNWSATAGNLWLPNAYVQGYSIDAVPLEAPPAALPTAADCASLCRSDPACSYFRYCELEVRRFEMRMSMRNLHRFCVRCVPAPLPQPSTQHRRDCVALAPPWRRPALALSPQCGHTAVVPRATAPMAPVASWRPSTASC